MFDIGDRTEAVVEAIKQLKKEEQFFVDNFGNWNHEFVVPWLDKLRTNIQNLEELLEDINSKSKARLCHSFDCSIYLKGCHICDCGAFYNAYHKGGALSGTEWFLHQQAIKSSCVVPIKD